MSSTKTRTAPFTFASHLGAYNAPPAAYLSSMDPLLTGLVVGAVIIHRDRVLLIQRAAHDGFPLLWECPGGSVDAASDPTVLHALCREVREETGLGVGHVADVVETVEFEGKAGGRWRKVTFAVELDGGAAGGEGVAAIPVVVLDPEEHVDSVWAAERDILLGKCDGREIGFAYEEQKQTVLKLLRKGDDKRGEGHGRC